MEAQPLPAPPSMRPSLRDVGLNTPPRVFTRSPTSRRDASGGESSDQLGQFVENLLPEVSLCSRWLSCVLPCLRPRADAGRLTSPPSPDESAMAWSEYETSLAARRDMVATRRAEETAAILIKNGHTRARAGLVASGAAARSPPQVDRDMVPMALGNLVIAKAGEKQEQIQKAVAGLEQRRDAALQRALACPAGGHTSSTSTNPGRPVNPSPAAALGNLVIAAAGAKQEQIQIAVAGLERRRDASNPGRVVSASHRHVEQRDARGSDAERLAIPFAPPAQGGRARNAGSWLNDFIQRNTSSSPRLPSLQISAAAPASARTAEAPAASSAFSSMKSVRDLAGVVAHKAALRTGRSLVGPLTARSAAAAKAGVPSSMSHLLVARTSNAGGGGGCLNGLTESTTYCRLPGGGSGGDRQHHTSGPGGVDGGAAAVGTRPVGYRPSAHADAMAAVGREAAVRMASRHGVAATSSEDGQSAERGGEASSYSHGTTGRSGAAQNLVAGPLTVAYPFDIDDNLLAGPTIAGPFDIGSHQIALLKSAAGLGMTLRNNPLGPTGVVVWTVDLGMAADVAGVRVGDVILSVENEIVDDVESLVEIVATSTGAHVHFELAGSAPSREVVLVNNLHHEQPIGLGMHAAMCGVGILVAEIDTGSSAELSDLQIGDCILSIDGCVPLSPNDAVSLILRADGVVRLVVIGDSEGGEDAAQGGEGGLNAAEDEARSRHEEVREAAVRTLIKLEATAMAQQRMKKKKAAKKAKKSAAANQANGDSGDEDGIGAEAEDGRGGEPETLLGLEQRR